MPSGPGRRPRRTRPPARPAPRTRSTYYTGAAHGYVDYPAGLAGSWQEALGWRQTYTQQDEVVLEPPEGSPEDGIVPDLLFLGARRADVGQGPGVSWVVMTRPGWQRVRRPGAAAAGPGWLPERQQPACTSHPPGATAGLGPRGPVRSRHGQPLPVTAPMA
ncbi:MAG: hypothetical protein ABJB47_16690 [Actinomycetota bacterium]